MQTLENALLGTVISGSLSAGLTVRISPDVPMELIKTGKFVSIISGHYTFFSLVTDVTLAVTNPDILLFPPTYEETFLASLLQHQGTYRIAEVRPMLMIGPDKRPVPVKTIPHHFAPVQEAHERDIAIIFGKESPEKSQYFHIGYPLDMQSPICIDLDKLTERSSGVFGKTGTGKTFLTRVLLAGLIKHQKAVTLIFDMHSEYGFQARKEGSSQLVKGIKTLFSDRVVIFSLDPAATRRRGSAPDVELAIPLHAIQIEDILSLQDELNLHPTALEVAHLIAARYKHEWLSVLLSQDNLKEFASEIGAHPESLSALHRKLKRIERYPFFSKSEQRTSVIDHMIEYIDRGISIIVEFGTFSSPFVYLLIANIISRRIHAHYIAKTEKFLGAPQQGNQPNKLVIVIEEAHKFLSPSAAKQTVFGIIAREMRKYYVSLLVVDQRPSSIESEVLSQIGTKIIAQLSDEKDIQAVLTGTSGAHTLRTILASLDSKKQALLLGHAIAMPVVIQTREYDETFYQSMQTGTYITKSLAELERELFN